MKLNYKIEVEDIRMSVKEVEEVEELFYQAMNDYIAYTKSLRYRMRMKKKPIKRKEILSRLKK